MNLNTVKIAPFAQGVIKVDSQVTEEGLTTLNRFAIYARHHDAAQTLTESRPVLHKHPIEKEVMEKVKPNAEAGKIVAIPMRMFFNRTDNAIGIKYQAYDGNGVPVCTGDGKTARRLAIAGDGTQTLQEVECSGCDTCPFANGSDVKCARQMRMTVQVQGQEDPLSTFEVRSGSLNSYRTLKAQLSMIERRFHGLRHVPLRLMLWQASNQQSAYQPFDAMRLEIDAPSEAQAFADAKRDRQTLADIGLDDDMDGVFSAEGLTLDACDEFSIVRDFYDEKPVRRTTAQKLSKESAGAHTSALDMISRAVLSQSHSARTEPETASI